DGHSGQVLWRLGGRQSSFTQAPGTRTAWQHDARRLPDGSIGLFDNRASPSVLGQSRGVVLSVDPQHKSVTLKAQFPHVPPLLTESQGNMQALENGDWFLGWGQLPYLSEFGPDGRLLFDAHLPAHEQSYRSFRFSWSGTPAHPPRFVLQNVQGARTIYASWNGATLIASWRVLAGHDPAHLQTVAEAPIAGFETALPLPSGSVGPDVAVQALDGAGGVLGTSATVFEPSL